MAIDSNYIFEIAKAACASAIKNGAEFADVSVGAGKCLSVEIESCKLKSTDSQIGSSISVRAIYKGGTGWSSSEKLDIEDAAESGKKAAELSKISEPDPDFISLPSPVKSYEQLLGMYDKELESMSLAELINYCHQNILAGLKVRSDAILSGGFGVSTNKSVFVNSLGIQLEKQSSRIEGSISAIVKEGKAVGSFYDFDFSRNLSGFNPTGISEKAVKDAIRYLGAKPIATAKMPVVFGPLASMSILGGITSNLDAESVLRGRSFMAGMVGTKIASDLLTITDDPLIPGGLSSRFTDSEGFPCKPLVLIKDGILNTFLYGSYTAGKAKAANTGHGSRGASASASNVIPKLGNKTAEEIISEVEEGIYINAGGLSPNPITGDVSASVDFGFKIENGKLAYPISSTIIGGNFIEMLRNIDAISSDYRSLPGLILPTIRIQNIMAAGAG